MDEQTNAAPQASRKNLYFGVGAIAVIIIALAAFAYARMAAPVAQTEPVKAEEDLAAVQFTPAQERGTGQYPNGTYTTVGTYAPHGVETKLEVTVTLVDDTITESAIRLDSTNGMSKDITKGFEEGYKEFVIGKPIQGLNVGKVARSSLTPLGYNMALRQIETYAQTL